jgi:hypothetical protein
MASINSRPLKAYVRFDGTGRIVPSSLILRRKMPKVGKWVEVPAYECCNPTTTTSTSTSTTTTTTTAAPIACNGYNVLVNDGETGNLTGIDCLGVPFNTDITGPYNQVNCYNVINSASNASITFIGSCPTTTTTTTAL